MPKLRSLRRAVLYGVTGALTLWFVAACATSAPPSTTPPPTPNPPSGATIEFVSERSVVLTRAGESAQLHAVVLDENDREVIGALVTWQSSDPEAVSVSADGVVEAHVAVGSAVVTASYGELRSDGATILVAELHPWTRLIESADVEDVSDGATRVVLRRTPALESIAVGDVLMSGERAGILVRVQAITADGDVLRIDAVVATLPDAFARLSANLVLPPLRLVADQSDEGQASATTAGLDVIAPHATPDLDCSASGGAQINMPIRLVRWQASVDFSPRFIVEIEPLPDGTSRTTHFAALLEMKGSLAASLGQITLGGALSGKVECRARMASLGPIGTPVGPFVLGMSVPTYVGADFDVAIEVGAEGFAFKPPEKIWVMDRRYGPKWTESDGWDWERFVSPEEEAITQKEPDPGRITVELSAKAEPYIEFNPALYAGIPYTPLEGEIEFLRVRGYAGIVVAQQNPFLSDSYGFKGPSVEAYLGALADIKPLIERLQLFNTLGRRLGLPTAEGDPLNVVGQHFGTSLVLVDERVSIGLQPVPMLTASSHVVTDEQPTVTFHVNLPISAVGQLLNPGNVWHVALYGFRDGDQSTAIHLGGLDTFSSNASIDWTPPADAKGTYEVFAVVFAGNELTRSLVWRFGTPTPVVVEVALDPKVSVRLDPPVTLFDPRFAPAGSIGVFDLVNDGDEVSFTVSNVNEYVHLIGPVAGVLPAGERVSVAYTWTCPEPVEVNYTLTLGFSIDGAPAGGDVPTGFAFRIECVDRPPPPCEEEDCEPGGGAPGDGSGGGSVDAGGLTGRSWGDPHLVTLDGRPYDFHATGDYILSTSTDPDDDFEVQVRYRALRPGDPWFGRLAHRISVGFGVAARVVGDVVNVIVNGQGLFEVYVDGALVQVGGNLDLQLPSRGTVQVRGTIATITWPDSTSLTLSAWRAWQLRFDYLEDIRLYVPTARFGQIEGLLGDADGDPLNDVRVRGGEVLGMYDTVGLYGAFRDSWRVPLGDPASLFAVGPDPFDPDYPGSPTSLSDFTAAERDAARALCEAAGVVSHAILQACMLDVLVTGDDDVAADAVLADPATPTVSVTPALAYVYPGSQRFFGAVVSGAPELRAEWSASGGTLEVLNDVYVRFTAPDEPGAVIDLSAWLASDDRVTGQARVIVLDLACGPTPGFDRSWLGGVDGIWSNPDNWLPAGAPGSGESAFVCADPTHAPRLTANAAVGDLVMAPGASLRLGTSTLAVHGALMLPGGGVLVESGALEVVGDGATLSGSLPALTIRAPTTAVDPVSFAGRLTIAGGRFDPAGHAVTVGEDLRTSGQGCLVMQSANDHVTVAGATVFAGSTAQSPACPLEAGTLELQGNVSVSGSNFSRLTPGAGHRALLSGAAPQVVSFSGVSVGHSQGNRFHDLTIANAAGVTFASDVDVRGELRFQGGAGTVDGDVTVHVGGDLVEPAGGDRWRVATTELRGADRAASLPATLHGNLAVRMATTLSGPEVIHGALTVAAPVTLSGALEVIGDLAIGAGANGRFDPAGHALDVGGDLRTTQFGCLVMAQAGGHVLVVGDAHLAGSTSQSPSCPMTAGTLELRGDVTLVGSQFSRLTPGAGHRVLLSGAGPQAVSFSGVALGHPSGNRFHDLTIANAAGVTFASAVDVRGTVAFEAAAGALTSGAVVYLGGDIDEPAGGGRWQVATTDLRGAERDALLPASIAGDLAVNASVRLVGPTAIAGDLVLGAAAGGRFDPAGHALDVGGDLRTTKFGCLVMAQAGGHVLVMGDAQFAGTTSQSLACPLNAGTLELRGDVTLVGSNFSRLTPVAGHRVLLSGAAPQAVSFSGVALGHPSGNRFHDLTIANAAGVTFASAVDVRGELDLVGRLTNQAALTIAARLTLRSASYLDGAAGSIALTSGECVVEPGADGVGWPPACGQP